MNELKVNNNKMKCCKRKEIPKVKFKINKKNQRNWKVMIQIKKIHQKMINKNHKNPKNYMKTHQKNLKVNIVFILMIMKISMK